MHIAIFKVICRISLYILIATILSISPVKNGSAQRTVKLANGEYPPINSRHLPYYGAGSHIVSAAFEAVGIKVEYGFFPWKRAYSYAQHGIGLNNEKWNGTLLWIYTEERARYFLYSNPVFEDTEVLYHLKSTPLKWNRVEDLKGLTIGGTPYTSYRSLEAAESEGIIKLSISGNDRSLFRKLLFNHVDAVPQTKYVGRYYLFTSLSDQERDQITFSPNPLEYKVYYLLLSKKIPENKFLLKEFNRGLNIIKNNGIYSSIIKALETEKYTTDHQRLKQNSN